jgi:CRP/FNR family transcriptional regulator, cyclic AMP receptor protein
MNIELYAKSGEPVRHRAGDVIFRKGDDGDVLYIVGSGEVELVLDERHSVKVGKGESFGEMSIIDKSPRSADAIAVSDVELYPINRGLFLVLVQDTPHFALELMKSLTDRLRRANAVGAA